MPAPDAPATLRAQQFALTRHLRDPAASPAPAGWEDRRLQVYRDLLFNNISTLLAGNFPVIRALYDDEWPPLVRAFYREHRSQTPLFPEIGREFLRFIDAHPDVGPPFLAELAHYEWVELALQIAEARPGDVAHDPEGDVLDGVPVLSPLAWPLAYTWPVQRLGPDYRPASPPPSPTLLLLRREPDGSVRFSELSPLAFRLVQRLGEAPTLTGRAQLLGLAAEAAAGDADAFVSQGQPLLAQMRATGVVLGTVPAA